MLAVGAATAQAESISAGAKVLASPVLPAPDLEITGSLPVSAPEMGDAPSVRVTAPTARSRPTCPIPQTSASPSTRRPSCRVSRHVASAASAGLCARPHLCVRGHRPPAGACAPDGGCGHRRHRRPHGDRLRQQPRLGLAAWRMTRPLSTARRRCIAGSGALRAPERQTGRRRRRWVGHRVPRRMSLYPSRQIPFLKVAVTGVFTTADGRSLRFARWRPEGAQGTVALFPGRAEFIEKYFEGRARTAGAAVRGRHLRLARTGRLPAAPAQSRKGPCAPLQRLPAGSGRLRPAGAAAGTAPAPHYALALSMGGTILLQAVLDGRRWFDRVVLSAPMLDIAMVPYPARPTRRRGSCAALGSGAPSCRGVVRPSSPTSPSRAIWSRPIRSASARAAAVTAKTPDLGLGSPTIGWLAGAYDAMGCCASGGPAGNPPAAAGGGGRAAERIVSNAAIEHVASGSSQGPM